MAMPESANNWPSTRLALANQSVEVFGFAVNEDGTVINKKQVVCWIYDRPLPYLGNTMTPSRTMGANHNVILLVRRCFIICKPTIHHEVAPKKAIESAKKEKRESVRQAAISEL